MINGFISTTFVPQFIWWPDIYFRHQSRTLKVGQIGVIQLEPLDEDHPIPIGIFIKNKAIELELIENIESHNSMS